MRPRQVQDFIPTPMAIATTMFYTGIDPLTGEPVYTARDMREKRMMKALIFYWDAQHWPLAREALEEGRPRRPHRPRSARARAARGRRRSRGRRGPRAPRPRAGGPARPTYGRAPRRR